MAKKTLTVHDPGDQSNQRFANQRFVRPTGSDKPEGTNVAPSARKPGARLASESNKLYYLVNPAGAVHSVTRAHAEARLRQVGWRLATADEAREYNARAVQTFDDPIAAPFAPGAVESGSGEAMQIFPAHTASSDLRSDRPPV